MKKIIIMGAAGRDFHNFNTHYRDNSLCRVVCFTATQIPNIFGKKYPKELAGKYYPSGIPIFSEDALEDLIKKYGVDEVVFSYSDVSNDYVMEKASRVLSTGANFELLGTKDTMLKSKKPVISVCAVRTGCGKSQTSRRIVKILKGKKVGVIRHPMPYGDLLKQEVQKFETKKDLVKHECTIEEREEYEPYLEIGANVYAGVNYKKILRLAEKENDIILWDGGNNDFPFIESDLSIVVVDPFRVGHEFKYYPGLVNAMMADMFVINKENTAKKDNIDKLEENLRILNEKAMVVHADSIIKLESKKNIRNKKVVVVDDGPTLTHGGMSFGAGVLIARELGAEIVKPQKYVVESIKQTFEKFPHLQNVIPAMGYSKQQLKDLETSLNRVPCDYIIAGTPIDLGTIIETNKPILRVKYYLKEKGSKFKNKIQTIKKREKS